MDAVTQEADERTQAEAMFVAQIGNERLELVIRTAAVGEYDTRYPRAMPIIDVSVANPRYSELLIEPFIVDTGSDITLVQDSLADRLDLWRLPSGRAEVSGIGSPPTQRQLFRARLTVAGVSSIVRVDCRDDISENILGRNIINLYAVFLCAKRDEVRFE